MSATLPRCVLCEEEGGTLVWRNDVLRVVMVDERDLPGFTRVIWHGHVPEMTDLGARERDEFMQAVYLVEGVQRQLLQPDKVNLASLGNMTPHLHWHVIPRWRDDPWYPDSIWSNRHDRDVDAQSRWRQLRRSIAQSHDDYAAALRASLELL